MRGRKAKILYRVARAHFPESTMTMKTDSKGNYICLQWTGLKRKYRELKKAMRHK